MTSDPYTSVQYAGDNKDFKPAYMDYNTKNLITAPGKGPFYGLNKTMYAKNRWYC